MVEEWFREKEGQCFLKQGRNGGEPICDNRCRAAIIWPMPNGVRRRVEILRYIITIFRLFPNSYCICDTTRHIMRKQVFVDSSKKRQEEEGKVSKISKATKQKAK
jgi:hypothetical protein